MRGDDDTVRGGAQAAEDVTMAVIEAGLDPHVLPVLDYSAIEPGCPMVVQRVTRAAAEGGVYAGALLAAQWATVPEHAHGLLVLSFDGWADDARALVEVQCVREFCLGLLGDGAQARHVLRVLMDERKLEPFMPDDWHHMAGGLWLVAHVVPQCWALGGRTGLMRDLHRNVVEYDARRGAGGGK